ncbi:MAG: DUF3892 domain-containing protein [bacterium]|nr:DUF3892 domain-containing protein [bacterium]
MAKKQIIDAKKDSEGKIRAVKFKGNATYTDIETAINMAKNDQIKNVNVSTSKNGEEYIRTNRDKSTRNNLTEMAKD